MWLREGVEEEEVASRPAAALNAATARGRPPLLLEAGRRGRVEEGRRGGCRAALLGRGGGARRCWPAGARGRAVAEMRLMSDSRKREEREERERQGRTRERVERVRCACA